VLDSEIGKAFKDVAGSESKAVFVENRIFSIDLISCENINRK